MLSKYLIKFLCPSFKNLTVFTFSTNKYIRSLVMLIPMVRYFQEFQANNTYNMFSIIAINLLAVFNRVRGVHFFLRMYTKIQSATDS